MSSTARKSFIEKRRAGILLHPTSLPGPQFCGDLGPNAYQFIEWMALSGLSVWQMLPLNPTPSDGSPYQCQSSFAGNTKLISVEQLVRDGFLEPHYARQRIQTNEELNAAIRTSLSFLETHADEHRRREFFNFCKDHQSWLDDWALFATLKKHYLQAGWTAWPEAIKKRDPNALAKIKASLITEIKLQQYAQFLFFFQWNNLKRVAAARKILLFGDLPIFVSHDSCDVWSQPEQFQLDSNGNPITVAGVPPDYFSETGQRWGNPHYNWPLMQQDNFNWWRRRIEIALQLIDILRIDHFRGLEAYWEIPAQEETAIKGRWQPAPGKALLTRLQQAINPLPIVAEDLGIITDEVIELRDNFNLPGMKILEFAFGGDASNPYLPHNHVPNCVVYTGTHDNNTLMGWIESLDEKSLTSICDYLACKPNEIAWNLIRSAMCSVSELAVIPMQDFLLLDEQHRMNVPGTLNSTNWKWRFNWVQIPTALTAEIRKLITLYGRII